MIVVGFDFRARELLGTDRHSIGHFVDLSSEFPKFSRQITDPISFFMLECDDYLDCGERMGRLAVPTVFCLEGGYGVPEIGRNAVNVLQGFEAGIS